MKRTILAFGIALTMAVAIAGCKKSSPPTGGTNAGTNDAGTANTDQRSAAPIPAPGTDEGSIPSEKSGN